MEKDKNPYRILVIEDNPGDFTLIEDFLEDQIYLPQIYQAKTFKEGELFLTESGEHVHVILLDLSLPDKSGEELITEILGISSGIPIVILTGYPDVAFSVKSLSLGVADYLVKDDLSASSLFKSILYSIERKKKTQELEESQRRYSDLFQLSPQPMWVYDTQTLRFLNVNSAAIKHYGYSFEEFLSMTIRDIRPIEELPKLDEQLERLHQNENSAFSGVYRHCKKNGEIVWAEIQSNVVILDNISARVVLVNDVTERLKYIQEIEEKNKKLQEIAWMHSHVFRAPVARLMSLIDLATNYENSETEQREFLDRMLASVQELDKVIRCIAGKTDEIDQ
ncbi:PAS domain S-box protein [Dyadobacter sp. CY345]|uniref:PAS domain-containing response regulator n=1 Tax=Dyadobacter sp. CY345 TaxID=2909335 RepID=UPI001F3069CE|nr:PAS domain S-box protein [Dyadobacter sp. CY345]MCF2447432.1 PAS domain S-box protein [Dyadobacter sp. CY345]